MHISREEIERKIEEINSVINNTNYELYTLTGARTVYEDLLERSNKECGVVKE